MTTPSLPIFSKGIITMVLTSDPIVPTSADSIVSRNSECRNFFESCMQILERKGRDYNHSQDGFSALKNGASAVNISVEKTIFLLMNKHFNSIRQYVANGELHSEPVEGRLRDLANFCAIFYSYLKIHGKLSLGAKVFSPEKLIQIERSLQALDNWTNEKYHNSMLNSEDLEDLGIIVDELRDTVESENEEVRDDQIENEYGDEARK